MKSPVCSVYDKISGLYDPPFTIRHVSEASRQFELLKKDENSRFGKHPGDYALHHIGFFDDNLAKFENLDHPVQLG